MGTTVTSVFHILATSNFSGWYLVNFSTCSTLWHLLILVDEGNSYENIIIYVDYISFSQSIEI